MTTATLRPDGTSSSTNITLTGAASINAATSDNSDASYAQSAASPASGSFVVTLGTVALPTGAVTKTVTLRSRCSQVANSFLQVVAPSAGVLLTRNRFSNASISDDTSPAAAVTLTQADVDALTIALVSTSDTQRFYELFVDLVYATVPVVVPSAPTGVVSTTTTPTMTWAYTAGSDGGAQSAYRIRVFTAAQYGAGGFDPATSTATYESGDVLSSATSAVLGPLLNSTTYRAYIWVAQTVNGNLHWSVTTGSSFVGFSLALTTSDITALTYTVDAPNGKITVNLTRNATLWGTVEVQRSDDVPRAADHGRVVRGCDDVVVVDDSVAEGPDDAGEQQDCHDPAVS
jgi:hypothetical protein